MHAQEESMTLEAATSAAGVAAGSTLSLAACGGTYDGKIAGLYDLEETLGSGHFAVVKCARHVFTGAKVAVKVVDKMKLDDVSKAHLFQEVRCMKLVQHPNVVRLYEVIDTQTKLYLVLELGDGGDLYDYIMKHEGGLSEDLARKYFRQILRAITYCHQLHVVHRDLKPENVVFFEKLGIVKLTDFGFSNKFLPGQKLETFCGSLAYSAPEILLGDSYDAPAVDIWSLGVILYMLVCGQAPFEKANDSETLTCIMDCNYTVPPHITATCRKLIASMLVRDPKKRANLEEIAADDWVMANADYDTSEFLPLVSRQQLTDDDHTFIIQKMVNGNIAAKEDILLAIEKDKYNHITATYFLLAEMRLRKRREEESLKQYSCNPVGAGNAGTRPSSIQADGGLDRDNQTGGCKPALPISISVSAPAPVESETKADKRSRKCSIVREEDEDESSYEYVGNANELAVAVPRHESISDGRLNRSVQKRSNVNAAVVLPMAASSKMVVSVDAALAHKLNQIDRHAMPSMGLNKGPGALDEASNAASVHGTRPLNAIQDALKGMKDLEIGKFKTLSASNKNPVLTHRRTKLNKIRTPSSSSEASDDDTKSRSKKKINKFVGDTPTRFRMHRRDSHDDSSDSQDQTFPSSASHSHTTIIAGNNSNSNVSGKSEGRTQSKEQNKTEDTRKSSHSHKTKKQPKDNSEKHSHSNRKSLSVIAVTRRCIRESQSLDRITEAQEYDMRHRCVFPEQHFDQRNSLFNLNSLSVAETKEEYDCESDGVRFDPDLVKNTINEAEASLKQKHNKNNGYNNLNAIEEIDFILERKSLTRAGRHDAFGNLRVTSSKCFVTMKKIRRLGKYFPVVNFT